MRRGTSINPSVLKRVAAFGVVTFVLSFGYTNCAPQKFDSVAADTTSVKSGGQDPSHTPPILPPGATPTPKPPGSDDPQIPPVKQACSQGNILEKTVQVKFPNPKSLAADPNKVCNWEQDGNVAIKDNYFTARVEQNVEFDLPTGAKICDMQFNFQTQSMVFDDHFFMAFDDALLSASYPVDDRLPIRDGIMTYDWSSLVGTAWPKGNFAYVYCLGEKEGYSSCSWPETQVQGSISMSFSPEVLQGITARNLGRTTHQFKFVTTGDNDPSSDCQHSDIEFSVKVKYSPN